MTAAVYTRAAATAKRLLTAAGAAVTFTRTAKTVNGSTGVVSNGASTTATGYAVQIPINSSPSATALDKKLAESALAGNEVAYLKVAALGMAYEPSALDVATWQGGTWQVVGCTAVKPAGLTLVYGVGMVKL